MGGASLHFRDDHARDEALDGAPIDSGLSSEVFADGPDRVLKLYCEPSEPAAIENEFRAARLAYEHGLPVARPFGIVRRNGRTGILFERLHGPTMIRAHRRNVVGMLIALRRLARIQHRIHALPAEDLPSQRDRLRFDIGWARVPEETRAKALAALDRLPAGDALCHGDIHPGNVVCTPKGLAILDWQKAAAGNPAADVARTELMIRYGRMKPAALGLRLALQALRHLSASWYVRCYCAASGMTRAEIGAWHLPLMVARLCARRTDKDAEILAIVERLMARPPSADGENQ